MNCVKQYVKKMIDVTYAVQSVKMELGSLTLGAGKHAARCGYAELAYSMLHF